MNGACLHYLVVRTAYFFDGRETKIIARLPAPGIAMSAATALIALLLSSSCFSYSCFTAFAFTFVVTVVRSGSTSLSSFVSTAPGQSCNE